MRHATTRWFLTSAAFAGVTVLAGCAAWRVEQGRELARNSEPFSFAPPDARARLLIVGDSTAVGTGASGPRMSVAGRLAADYPKLTIVNRGQDGARFAAVADQITAAPAGPYDVVLIMAGGNDVIFLTSEPELRAAIERAVTRAKALAPVVILMPAGNVGNAPFFFPPLSWVMTARARRLHANVREVASREGATYVNLYEPRESDPFAQQPKRMNAADGLHPSDDGYALWHDQLLRQSPLASSVARS